MSGCFRSETWAEVQKREREFRVRQYVEGYQLRGERNPECDVLAQQFLTNWIGSNYGGTVDTNLPSLAELGDRLASDPACQDPLMLTVAAVNVAELHEKNRRLERADHVIRAGTGGDADAGAAFASRRVG